ncbi:MAG TPA: hypothetical protein VIK55_12130 [Paludibacter sp.]
MTHYKIITFISICFIFVGCSFLFSPYTIVEDEFKHSKTQTLEQNLYPVDRFSVVTNANVTYERVISDTKESVNMYFIIARKSNSFKIDNKAFMKADGKSYEVSYQNIETDYKTHQESNTTSTTTKDSTKVKTEYKTEVKNYDWYDDKFIVQLTPEMVNSMLKTDEILFRFYFGPKQVTFKITGYSLRRVQKLFVN